MVLRKYFDIIDESNSIRNVPFLIMISYSIRNIFANYRRQKKPGN